LYELNGKDDRPKVIKKVENEEKWTLEAISVIQNYIDAYKY